MGSPTILSRARYAEDCLEEAVGEGACQYVILGAGMDTFAFRRPELLRQIEVFEVDHPATQEYKRHRISELGWEIPRRMHFTALDLTRERLADALIGSGFNPSRLTFVSMLGVSMYLEREVFFSVLSDITGIVPAGSSVVFDYLHPQALSPENSDRRAKSSRERVARIGEPMKSGFNPSELAAEMSRFGLRLRQNLGPYDIEARYFRGCHGAYPAHSYGHFAWAVTAQQ
jgi:methyltransferase (TIGR00027 family)